MQTKQEHPMIIQQLIYLLTLSVKFIGSNFFAKLLVEEGGDVCKVDGVDEKLSNVLSHFTDREGQTLK
jgi:hypothetical protein